MQRINLFLSPGFINGVWGGAQHTVDNGEMKVLSAPGDIYSAVTLPAVGRDELVLSIEVKGGGSVRVYNDNWRLLTRTEDFHNVRNWIVKNLRFTPTDGKDLLIIFFPFDGWLTVRRPQLELASTFDAIGGGGASKLLHGRHHATRLTPAAGVMQDDDNQHGQKSGSQHHHITQRGSDHSMRSVDGRRQLSGQHIRQRQWRHSLIGFAHYRQINEGQLDTDADCNSDQVFSRFRRAIRQADRHRDAYSHLHGCRVSDEQDPARRHRIFLRGHDAARLTLLGVVA